MNESEILSDITKPKVLLAYQVSSNSEMVMWKLLLKWLGMTPISILYIHFTHAVHMVIIISAQSQCWAWSNCQQKYQWFVLTLDPPVLVSYERHWGSAPACAKPEGWSSQCRPTFSYNQPRQPPCDTPTFRNKLCQLTMWHEEYTRSCFHS